MKETTLCYIEHDGMFLMLHRTKKMNDPNDGKWIGIGGKIEAGETPEECIVREVKEETGLALTDYEKRGVIDFISDTWENERMYLYSANGYVGSLNSSCDEGELAWIAMSEVLNLNLWEGDRVFLKDLSNGKRNIRLVLRYEGDKLVSYEYID